MPAFAIAGRVLSLDELWGEAAVQQLFDCLISVSALRAAQEDSRLSWTTIAAATGYYDQAHLIEEFRTIAGVTPRALVSEIGVTS